MYRWDNSVKSLGGRTAGWLFALILMTQSISAPGLGGAKIGIPLAMAFIMIVLFPASIRFAKLFWLALIMSSIVLIATAARTAGTASINSAGLLALLLILTTIRPRVDGRAVWLAMHYIGRATSVACIIQLLAQVVGVRFISLQTLFPQAVLSDYNSVSRFNFGSALYRSNGFLYLEPANAAQVIALGIVAGSMLSGSGKRRWELLSLIAMATTGTGTGFILLGAFYLTNLVRRNSFQFHGFAMRRKRALVTAVTLMAIVAVLGTITGRVFELTSSTSSFYFRFVSPYSWTLDIYTRDSEALVYGIGAGNSDRIVQALTKAEQNADVTVFPVVPKLFLEYGLLIGLLLFGLLVHNTVSRWPVGTRVVGFLFVVVVNGGPLNPAVLIPAWLLGAQFDIPRSRFGHHGGPVESEATSQSSLRG